jgi:hypothetical protein
LWCDVVGSSVGVDSVGVGVTVRVGVGVGVGVGVKLTLGLTRGLGAGRVVRAHVGVADGGRTSGRCSGGGGGCDDGLG